MKKHVEKEDLSSNLEQTSQNGLKENNPDCSKPKEKKKKRRLLKVIHVFLWVFFLIPMIIVVLSGSVLVIEAATSPNDIPGNFRYKPCVERYGLMEPTLQKGDLIIVERTDFSELEEGDIIAYHLDGQDSIGRIISIAHSGLNVKADNDESTGEVFVPTDCIQGKYYGFRIPFLGWIVLFIQNSWWVLILIPCFAEMCLILAALFKKRFFQKPKTSD